MEKAFLRDRRAFADYYGMRKTSEKFISKECRGAFFHEPEIDVPKRKRTRKVSFIEIEEKLRITMGHEKNFFEVYLERMPMGILSRARN